MNKYERCLWIVNTLNEYGKASLKELNDRWIRSSLNYEGEEILPRTFARDKEFIASTFQLDIEYDNRLKKYELTNADDIKESSLYKYLLGSFHINNLSSMALKHRNKVMIQDINTGVEKLSILLDAIDRKQTVCFNYTSYYAKETPYSYEVIPCFIRLFKHRWYLICEYIDRTKTRVLALERMQNLRIGKQELIPSSQITPQTYYHDCFGIIRDDKQPEYILLKVYNKQVDYVRSVPIHQSQTEIETGDNYAIFQYYLRPSFDFIQHLLWHRENIEVIQPNSLREEIKSILKQILDRYK